jgi:hypothetical protein
MGTIWNPSGLTTNCGFCSIAQALFLKGIHTDADKLYLETLEHLGIKREGNKDPIPRQLIFPDPFLDSVPIRTEYKALADAGRGPSSYTISSVASDNNLPFALHNRDLTLFRQFFDFYAHNRHGSWDIATFVDMRLEFLHSHGNKQASAASVRKHVLDSLGGHSIFGSKAVNHYINVEIDKTGHIKATDAQDGQHYDGGTLHTRLRAVDMVMHLRLTG